jgi:hypothetical protein
VDKVLDGEHGMVVLVDLVVDQDIIKHLLQ